MYEKWTLNNSGKMWYVYHPQYRYLSKNGKIERFCTNGWFTSALEAIRTFYSTQKENLYFGTIVAKENCLTFVLNDVLGEPGWSNFRHGRFYISEKNSSKNYFTKDGKMHTDCLNGWFRSFRQIKRVFRKHFPFAELYSAKTGKLLK